MWCALLAGVVLCCGMLMWHLAVPHLAQPPRLGYRNSASVVMSVSHDTHALLYYGGRGTGWRAGPRRWIYPGHTCYYKNPKDSLSSTCFQFLLYANIPIISHFDLYNHNTIHTPSWTNHSEGWHSSPSAWRGWWWNTKAGFHHLGSCSNSAPSASLAAWELHKGQHPLYIQLLIWSFLRECILVVALMSILKFI